MENSTYLPDQMPVPVPASDGLDAQFWAGLSCRELRLQKCSRCAAFQWGPEWICHKCLAWDPDWVAVEPVGHIYSFERVWHPVHESLAQASPYLIVLVEIRGAGSVRMVGNLLGDPLRDITIGTPVVGEFEDHDGPPQYTLLNWRIA